MSTTNKKFYTDVQIKSDIIIDNATAGNVPVFDGSKKLKSSSVTSTELGQLSGVTSNVQTQIDSEITARQNADTTLQSNIDAVQAEIDALPDPVVYKGTWNATTNSPTLSNSDSGKAGYLYYVSVAGSVDFGAGSISFAVGDKVVNNGSTWDKWDMTDAVSSVFGRTGAVVAQASDYDASQIDYDNASSGLTATDAQAAIDEIKTLIDNFTVGSPGDIEETSFSLTNNQSSAADVTGLAFANGVVRSFQAIVSVYIDASSDLFEQFELNGIQRGSDWVMSIESEGDDSGLSFSITSAGQVQYTSSNVAGFTSGVAKFRAITTSI